MSHNIESLRIRPAQGNSVMGVFRQLVSQGGIKFNFGLVSIEPKQDDMNRIHDIIHEIDNRRVFKNAFEDEIPAHMIASVLDARKAIHEIRKGIWADLWARQVVQQILHDLEEFLTWSQKSELPRSHHDAGFDSFADRATELRLRIWSSVAECVAVFGDAVRPMHMPEDLYREVKAEFDRHQSS